MLDNKEYETTYKRQCWILLIKHKFGKRIEKEILLFELQPRFLL